MASLRTPQRLKCEGARSGLYGGWEKTVHPSSVIASYVLKLGVLLCIVTMKEDFSNMFVRLNSPEMLLQGLKSLNIQI